MKLWTIKGIAKLTDFSERTVRRAISSGELQSTKVKGSRRVAHEWLVKWLGFDPLNPTSPTTKPAESGTGQPAQEQSR